MAVALTVERKFLKQLKSTITESEFLTQVIDLAHALGWKAQHTRAARTRHGWITPIQGDAGFPDLVIAKTLADGNTAMVISELKTNKGGVTVGQREWLDLLSDVDGIYVFLWKPSQWDDIVKVVTAKGLPDIIQVWRKSALSAASRSALSPATRKRG